MSHDQKPGKMRVVGSSAAAAPQRRRGDTGSDAGGAIVAGAAGGAGSAAGAGSALVAGEAMAAAPSGKLGMMPVMLFIAGCAIGGAALPLLGII